VGLVAYARLVATIEDVLELLTDPANRSRARARGGMAQMNPTAIINELRSRSAEDEVEARALALDALAQLGGEDRSFFHTGLGRGTWPRRERIDDFWVPEGVLRG
jgi:hypothetical protein